MDRRSVPRHIRIRAFAACVPLTLALLAARAGRTLARTDGPHRSARHHARPGSSAPATVIRTLEHVVRVVPAALKILVVVLSFLVLVGTVAYFLLARTTRYLARQRK